MSAPDGASPVSEPGAHPPGADADTPSAGPDAEALFVEWLADRDAGGSTTLDALAERHPAQATALAALAAEWEQQDVDGLFAGVREVAAALTPSRLAGLAGPLPPAVQLEPGTRIGDFRLDVLLGQGGMGQVWRATELGLDREVALKVVRPGRETDRALRFFDREGRAGGRLRHPGIVPVYQAGAADGVHYIAQELVGDGTTLADVLAGVRRAGHRGRDYDQRMARCVRDVARALAAAHAAGVVHRDVKPGNVLIDADDRPRVTDFGLARMADDPTESHAGGLLGTFVSMSPEQAAGGEVGPASDLFSLGGVLYEALTLRRPFDGDDAPAVLAAIQHDDPVDPRRLRPGVPADLAVIALTCLEKDPSRRYPSMDALADDLQRWLEHRPIVARPPGPLRRAERWARRHPTTTVGLAVGLAALIVIGTLLVEQAVLGVRYQGLSDGVVLADLIEAADALYPPHPELLPRYDAWLADAAELGARLGLHRERLALAAAHGRRADPGGARPPLVFDDVDERFAHDAEAELVAGLTAFLDPERGLVADVRRRRAYAADLDARTRSGAAVRPLWDAAVDAVAADPRFEGLALRPQLDLVPLGADPRSGLQEFVHVGTGSVPTRGDDGALQLAEDAGVVLVLIPGGSFSMGANARNWRIDEPWDRFDPLVGDLARPSHLVALAPYLIGKHELTQAQWVTIMGDNPADFAAGETEGAGEHAVTANGLHPVENVSQLDGREFARRTGLALPTEARWERAARGGTNTPFWTGGIPHSLVGAANLADVSFDRGRLDALHDWAFEDWLEDGWATHAPVDRLAPNPFGLHHVHGNVKEWCADSVLWYAEDGVPEAFRRTGRGAGGGVPPRPGDGLRLGDEPGRLFIQRGGSFLFGANQARVAHRDWAPADAFGEHIGLRMARDLEE